MLLYSVQVLITLLESIQDLRKLCIFNSGTKSIAERSNCFPICSSSKQHGILANLKSDKNEREDHPYAR